MMQALKSQDSPISLIDDILIDLAAGKPVIMVDDEDRENEGDLIIAADLVTQEQIAMMIRECSGIICLAMPKADIERLNLEFLPRRNVLPLQAPFTVSIEAKEGVSTGVSAADRLKTIRDAIDPKRGPDDISTPGHIFPLMAQDGGVFVRDGHTEAAVDLCKLASVGPCAVICEIMNADGSMARLSDLIPYADTRDYKIGTIADLIEYRRQKDA